MSSRQLLQISEGDHIRGPLSASVTLLEYGDFECPYCGQAYPIVKAVKEIEKDKLRVAFRHFPLSEIHPHSLHAAFAAEAAGLQGKFWQMHDMLFENQHALEDKDLIVYAETLDLDPDQFKNDMESPQVQQRVRDDFMSGVRSGVNGTPTFYINGVRYDGSYQSEYLLVAVESAYENSSMQERRSTV